MPTFTGTANPDILYGTISADTLEGLAADDLLYGFDGHDLVLGGEGDDLLQGGSGNDTFDGGAGTDIIFGPSGLDTVTYANSLSGITLNLADASASTGDAAGDMFFLIETFVLTGKNDTLLGVGHNLTFRGGDGHDLLDASTGANKLFGDGGSGADDISVTFGLAGSQGNLTVKGGSGDDNLTIGSNAAPGASVGGAMIEGGAGNDAIIDTTNAALAANLFIFGAAWGQDVVAGFDDAVDRIVFSGTAAAGLDDFADLVISGTNEETTLSFGLNSVTLIGLDVGNFTAADVIFQ